MKKNIFPIFLFIFLFLFAAATPADIESATRQMIEDYQKGLDKWIKQRTPTANVLPDLWREITPAVKPPARVGHAMVESKSEMYVSGGRESKRGGGVYNDLWKWDRANKKWSELNPTNAPPRRASHSAAAAQDKIYIFSGADGKGKPLADGWSYDNEKGWAQEKMTGDLPAPSLWHTSTACADGNIYFFGGAGSDGKPVDANIRKYDPATGSVSIMKDHPSSSLYGHSALAVGNKIYIFGGHNGAGYSHTVGVYDTFRDTWTEMLPSGDLPAARAFHAAAIYGNSFWVFGGEGQGKVDLRDTWEFSIAAQTWTRHGDLPMPIQGAQVVMFASEWQGILSGLLFGGSSGKSVLNRTFEYHTLYKK